MNNITSYCIELTPGQLDYLAGSKYGIDRMKILHCLISAVVLKETVYSIKGFTTTLQAGQAIMSEVDLSNRLHYDKKTISRVLDRMNELGIVATTQSNRTSVHSLKCVSAWIADGKMVSNPFRVQSSIVPMSMNDGSQKDSQKHSPLSADISTDKDNKPSADFPTCKRGKPMADDGYASLFPLFEEEPPVYSDDGELLRAPSPCTASSPTDMSEDKAGGDTDFAKEGSGNARQTF